MINELMSVTKILNRFEHSTLTGKCSNMAILLGLFFFLIKTSFAFSDSQTSLQKHVEFLCSGSLEGRMTGSVGEKRAARYIADQFHQLGLLPSGENGTFFQDFPFKQQQHGRNVLAKLIIDPHATDTIIVSAHLDHLGRGYPGADDNASGVASLLEIAAKLRALQKKGLLHGNKNILFAAWSGEELGILGSSYFVKNFMKTSSPHSRIAMAINLDMIGHLQKKLILQGTGSSLVWQRLLNKMKAHHSLAFITQKDPYLPTDSTAFYLRGIPTLNFFTGAHAYYHSSKDTPDTLNYAGMQTISNFLADFLLALETSSEPITYHAMTKPKEAADEQKLRIYLGTIPDYSQSNKSGVALSGVIKDSPAERAGIQQNDIVLALEGKKIRDIYEYTAVLNALAVKKPTQMVVLRHRTQKILTVVPIYR